MRVACLFAIAATVGCGKDAVTLQEYQRVQVGMSYDEVCGIIGSPGKETGRTSVAGAVVVEYEWKNGFMSGMSAAFQGNSLLSKDQIDLK